LLARLTPQQIGEVEAFAQDTPPPHRRADIAAAMIAYVCAKGAGAKRAKLEDFVIAWGPAAVAGGGENQSDEEMARQAAKFAAMFAAEQAAGEAAPAAPEATRVANQISKLAVVITANAAGFAGPLKQGETALKQLGATAEGVKGILSGWQGLLGAVGLGFSLWAGLEKAEAAETAVAKLDSVLRSTGGAAGFSGEALEKLSLDLAQITRFSKTATVNAAAVLATFTNVRGDVFTDALRAAQNLSTVLDQDLQVSVVQLGKALNDPAHGYTALKRAGVSFSQSQIATIKAMQESGNLMGAQKIILRELATEFGGAAEAAGGGFGAQIDRAKAAVGSIATSIVGAALPALAKMAGLAREGALWVKSHGEAIQFLAKVLVGVVTAVTAYKTALFALTAAQRAYAAGLAIVKALEGPTGWLQLAGAAAAAAAGLLVVNAAFDGVEAKATNAGGAGVGAARAIQAQMDGATEETQGLAEAMDGVAGKTKSVSDRVAELTAKLEDQVKTYGLSEREAEIYRLALAGASQAEIDKLSDLKVKLDQLDAQKKDQEEMARSAKNILEEIRDPAEKLQDALNLVNELERRGLLTAEQADTASRNAADNLLGDKLKDRFKQKKSDLKNFNGEKVGALERRFTAGFTSDTQSPLAKIGKHTERAAKASEAAAKAAAQIAKNTATPPAVVDF
jgi:hypothetical protein